MIGDARRDRDATDPGCRTGSASRSSIIDGHPTLGHSGRFLGFRSVVRWLPDDGVAIAVLTNQSRTDPAPVASTLLRIALGSRPIACRLPRGDPG